MTCAEGLLHLAFPWLQGVCSKAQHARSRQTAKCDRCSYAQGYAPSHIPEEMLCVDIGNKEMPCVNPNGKEMLCVNVINKEMLCVNINSKQMHCERK